MKNIIGYSSDTNNVMFDEHNPVSKLLKSEVPTIQLVNSFGIFVRGFEATEELGRPFIFTDHLKTTGRLQGLKFKVFLM